MDPISITAISIGSAALLASLGRYISKKMHEKISRSNQHDVVVINEETTKTDSNTTEHTKKTTITLHKNNKDTQTKSQISIEHGDSKVFDALGSFPTSPSPNVDFASQLITSFVNSLSTKSEAAISPAKPEFTSPTISERNKYLIDDDTKKNITNLLNEPCDNIETNVSGNMDLPDIQ